MKLKNSSSLFILVSFLLALVGMLITSKDRFIEAIPAIFESELLFSLTSGYVVSVIFWFFMVQRPDANRRKLIKNSFKQSYVCFREDLVQILIWSVRGCFADVKEIALDHQKIRAFFDREKRYAIKNELQGNPTRISEIFCALEIFDQDVNFVLNNVFFDEESLYVLKTYRQRSYHLQNSGYDASEQVKPLMNLVWEILAIESFANGASDDDPFQRVIDQI